jgi:protein-arginine kinase activator protein McsA
MGRFLIAVGIGIASGFVASKLFSKNNYLEKKLKDNYEHIATIKDVIKELKELLK